MCLFVLSIHYFTGFIFLTEGGILAGKEHSGHFTSWSSRSETNRADPDIKRTNISSQIHVHSNASTTSLQLKIWWQNLKCLAIWKYHHNRGWIGHWKPCFRLSLEKLEPKPLVLGLIDAGNSSRNMCQESTNARSSHCQASWDVTPETCVLH